jgi:hypothetical protein
MPTPIQHLVLAQDILADAALPPWTREHLIAQRGAFLLGTIAPDVQSVSGQAREATHFFTLPSPKGDLRPTDTRPAHEVMLAEYPALACANKLPAAQAAFIAGYIQHLTLDELWIEHVFGPHFGMRAEWGTFRERLLIHNVLRTWLDQRDGIRLNGSVSEAIAQVEPHNWLPFVSDVHLTVWRDEIALQLRPGAPVRTVEVFAARLNVPPAEFRRILESPDDMQRRVFAHLSPNSLARFYADALQVSVRRITDYVRGV